MRTSHALLAAVGATALLSACNSAAPLYASGPWWPGVVGPRPGYPVPIISPKPFAVDPPAVAPYPYVGPLRIARAEVRTDGRTDVRIPADPLPPHDARLFDPPPPMSTAPPARAVPAPPRQAGLSPAPGVPAGAPSTHPSSYAGAWTAVVDARGASCRVLLSSAPALDLYKASSSGCANAGLKSVNAWSLRDGSVFLFSHGSVVARLAGLEASLSGSLNSGEALRMTR